MFHTGDEPFSCSTCNKSYSQLGNLNVHKRTHTGEKPFICPKCDMRFSQPSHLKKHDERHHNTGESSFKKIIFGQHNVKSCSQSSYFKRQETVHMAPDIFPIIVLEDIGDMLK